MIYDAARICRTNAARDNSRYANINLFTTILVVYGVLAYLSERSYEKEIERRKYERNLSLSTSSLTKVELEINELQKGAYSNAK